MRAGWVLASLICLATAACSAAAPSESQVPDPSATAVRTTGAPSAAPRACAPDVVLEEILAVSPAERLACLGDTTVTLRGYHVVVFGAGGCSGDEVPGDGWLRPCVQGGILLSPDPGVMDGLLVLLHPGSGLTAAEIPTATLIEVAGHFDDPAAADCELQTNGAPESDPEFIQACREVFVATRVEEVDP